MSYRYYLIPSTVVLFELLEMKKVQYTTQKCVLRDVLRFESLGDQVLVVNRRWLGTSLSI